MSIAVLTQVYDEMRRLAIAGSSVAAGDFRLKKLVPPLEKSGEKAPVFAKVAQAATAVVESNEKTAPAALLELATLVNAILYTQGETGKPGDLQPIETVDLGARQTQASARLLKPLLEALFTTGSGRLEIIRDAIDRGVFADLRLVKAALKGLDDPYPEIGELIADKVLPMYGLAILPEIRRQFNLKGKAGHLHRLRVMHRLDPTGTREIVQQTLDDGSKELKVVAIECLGDSEEDLTFLLQQAKAKAKDVRVAALIALTRLVTAEAIEAVTEAASGADLAAIVNGLREAQVPALRKLVIAESEKQLEALSAISDKKALGTAIERLMVWLRCLDGRHDADAESLLKKLFQQRTALAEMSAEPSGTDVNETVAYLMANGSAKMQQVIVDGRESLTGPPLSYSFDAARRALPAKKVFEMYSPYLKGKPDKKSKKAAEAFSQSEAIRNALCDNSSGYAWRWGFGRRGMREAPPELDPRWLDVAVEQADEVLMVQLARPNHPALNQWLSQKFAAKKKATGDVHVYDILRTMIDVQHPEATACVIQTLQDLAKSSSSSYSYWLTQIIPSLPKTAVTPLEALLPTLPEKMVNPVLEAVLELKNRSDDVAV